MVSPRLSAWRPTVGPVARSGDLATARSRAGRAWARVSRPRPRARPQVSVRREPHCPELDASDRAGFGRSARAIRWAQWSRPGSRRGDLRSGQWQGPETLPQRGHVLGPRRRGSPDPALVLDRRSPFDASRTAPSWMRVIAQGSAECACHPVGGWSRPGSRRGDLRSGQWQGPETLPQRGQHARAGRGLPDPALVLDRRSPFDASRTAPSWMRVIAQGSGRVRVPSGGRNGLAQALGVETYGRASGKVRRPCHSAGSTHALGAGLPDALGAGLPTPPPSSTRWDRAGAGLPTPPPGAGAGLPDPDQVGARPTGQVSRACLNSNRHR